MKLTMPTQSPSWAATSTEVCPNVTTGMSTSVRHLLEAGVGDRRDEEGVVPLVLRLQRGVHELLAVQPGQVGVADVRARVVARIGARLHPVQVDLVPGAATCAPGAGASASR